MTKLLTFSLGLLLIISTTGCAQFMSNRTEIDRIFNTRIIAINKIEENSVLYTIATKTGVSGTQEQQGNPHGNKLGYKSNPIRLNIGGSTR